MQQMDDDLTHARAARAAAEEKAAAEREAHAVWQAQMVASRSTLYYVVLC